MNPFGLMSVIVPLMFLMVFGTFFVVIIRSLTQWNKNNQSPRLRVSAMVVAKRISVHHSAGEHHHTSTSYYVTFQVESGDRMELYLSGSEYGMLVEGDMGYLSFQGTRYLGFERLPGGFPDASV